MADHAIIIIQTALTPHEGKKRSRRQDLFMSYIKKKTEQHHLKKKLEFEKAYDKVR